MPGSNSSNREKGGLTISAEFWLTAFWVVVVAAVGTTAYAFTHFESASQAAEDRVRVAALEESVDEVRINLALAMKDQGVDYQHTARRPAATITTEQ